MLNELIEQFENEKITQEELNKKFTRRIFFEEVSKGNTNEYIIAKALLELKKLDKAQEKAKTRPTKASKENLKLIQLIEDELDLPKEFLASEVAEKLDITTQKASAILRQMVKLGKAIQKDNTVKSKPKLYIIFKEDENGEIQELTEE